MAHIIVTTIECIWSGIDEGSSGLHNRSYETICGALGRSEGHDTVLRVQEFNVKERPSAVFSVFKYSLFQSRANQSYKKAVLQEQDQSGPLGKNAIQTWFPK